MHDLLYENQQALDDRSLALYADKLGLDQKLIEAASGGAFATRVRRDFSSGVRSGVNGTPCLFINGDRFQGAWDARSLLRVLE
jgi:protein-disulfide isomerase